MAPTQKRQGSHTSVGSFGFYAKKMRTKPTANMVAQIKKVIRRDQETKYLDNLIDGVDLASGSVTSLNSISEGVDDGERIGRRIRTKYIQAHIAAGSTTTCRTWVALVLDRQPNNAVATFADIMTGQLGFELKNVQNNPERFKLLVRKDIDISSNGPNQLDLSMFYQFPVDNKDGDVSYSTTDVPTTNMIYLVGGTSNVDGVFVVGTIRYAYTDA